MRNYITNQLHYVELKHNRFVANMYKNRKRGGATIIFLGIVSILILIFGAFGVMDYVTYTMKFNNIKSSMDYASMAAIQEIKEDENIEVNGTTVINGINTEVDENGEANVYNIFIDENKAIDAFYSTFKINAKISKNSIKNNESFSRHIMFLIANPVKEDNGTVYMQYILRYNDVDIAKGIINDPSQLQGVLNLGLQYMRNSLDTYSDKKKINININNNQRVNAFRMSPYFITVIDDWQINGIFSKRQTTFISVSDSKIYRK